MPQLVEVGQVAKEMEEITKKFRRKIRRFSCPQKLRENNDSRRERSNVSN